MIILESWKYYEVDIFKLTDNMSDKFIMWSVTLSRDLRSSLLSSSRRPESGDFRRERSERWFRMVKLNHFLTGSKEITGNAKSLKSQTSRIWFNLNSARAITCTNLKMCTMNSTNKNSKVLRHAQNLFSRDPKSYSTRAMYGHGRIYPRTRLTGVESEFHSQSSDRPADHCFDHSWPKMTSFF